jgi:hypothetical protein
MRGEWLRRSTKPLENHNDPSRNLSTQASWAIQCSQANTDWKMKMKQTGEKSDIVKEVSSSSSHVLDRATEILTAFPPSKNRPRPGDCLAAVKAFEVEELMLVKPPRLRDRNTKNHPLKQLVSAAHSRL